ncbi:HugZ family protein [Rubellicoccus peritrichatus]|uniref:Pyridoxamine 5'-phosphate oxidase family protein n=1 Tax=Rubellicoccus peritrichatus TaxID=3080537 RepID=A0AAQ3QRG7_9BACT|nr:pyridoxamine 5'-phosphate oxidase family protein [Puniceicoccus sp. CR14]WOO39361.1 pyridoxamine 5'-phosphate oxidase family protein [Puniceicoccus sp. CR14]
MIDESQNNTAQTGLQELIAKTNSAILATTNSEKQGEASYSPYVMDETGNFYIFISEAAKHTKNLMDAPTLSLMLIEDEAECRSIFARKRLTLKCDATFISRDDAVFDERIAQFKETHGAIVSTLVNMTDFHLVRLAPESGRLVIGFGQAYDVKGTDFSNFQHATVGHRQAKKE